MAASVVSEEFVLARNYVVRKMSEMAHASNNEDVKDWVNTVIDDISATENPTTIQKKLNHFIAKMTGSASTWQLSIDANILVGQFNNILRGQPPPYRSARWGEIGDYFTQKPPPNLSEAQKKAWQEKHKEEIAEAKTKLASLHQKLGEDGRAALYHEKILNPDYVEKTSAREAFLAFFAQRMELLKQHPQIQNQPPLKMEQLLGKTGLQLYEAALKEEYASRAFRDAVFLSSTRHYKGPPFKEPINLMVVGASGTGKSTCTAAMIEQLMAEPSRTEADKNTGNDVVSIDGGVEREMSQMRKILIQGAEDLGYQGIKDIEKFNESILPRKIKSDISKAVQKAPKKGGKSQFHTATPITCVPCLNSILAKVFLSKVLSKNKGKVTIVANVIANKEQTAIAGRLRAFRESPLKFLSALMSLNNKEDVKESKDYNPANYDKGANGSNNFMEAAKEAGCDCFVINNILLHMKQIDGQWCVCSKTQGLGPGYSYTTEPYIDGTDVKINKTDFDWWNKQSAEFKHQHPLEAWAKRTNPDKIGPVIAPLTPVGIEASLDSGVIDAESKQNEKMAKKAQESLSNPTATTTAATTTGAGVRPPQSLIEELKTRLPQAQKLTAEKQREIEAAPLAEPQVMPPLPQIPSSPPSDSSTVAQFREEEVPLNIPAVMPDLPPTPGLLWRRSATTSSEKRSALIEKEPEEQSTPNIGSRRSTLSK